MRLIEFWAAGLLASKTSKGCSIESSVLLYAPMVMLELQVLMEIGRLRCSARTVLADLRQEIGLEVCTRPYPDVVEVACRESWTRAPDRVVKSLRGTPPADRFVSAITAFEIGYKVAIGKLLLSKPPAVWFPEVCAKRGLTVLPITDSVALRAAALPRHHRDPADRFIIPAAQELSLTVLTPDPLFTLYDVDVLWD